MSRSDAMDTVERVLAVVELVPRGSVVTYGDVAGLAGTSARRVGAVMSAYGSGVPWWRVVNASGELPPHLRERVTGHWLQEGIEWARSGRGCRIRAHRADLVGLADAVERTLR